jgi:hypothetical protein
MARGGPPNRRDDQTGGTTALARWVAAGLPGATAKRNRFEVDGTVFMSLGPDDLLIGTERVLPDQTARDELRHKVEESWRSAAPRRLVTVFAETRAKRSPTVSFEDIRSVTMSFPGVVENHKIRRDGDEVIHWLAGKMMFAKFGEAGNLLRPDLDDTLLIRRCVDRAALLDAHPDRFFITRHYGDPSDSGPILTRLSENTIENLPELRELIEDSWLHVAPKGVGTAYLASRR